MRMKTLHVTEFRHLKDLIIHDLADINIFVGPNNAGKTSLLRAIEASFPADFVMPEVAAALKRGEQHEDAQKYNLAAVATPSVYFGIPFKEEFLTKRLPIRARRDVSAIQAAYALRHCAIGMRPSHCGTEKYQYGASGACWGELPALARLFQNYDGPTNGQVLLFDSKKNYPILVEKEINIWQEVLFSDIWNWHLISISLHAWQQNSFFLWHRRKSEYLDALQTQRRLDTEAVHLAARLDHLRSERPREFHEKLEQFVNAIIPGLGEPATRRLDGNRVEIVCKGIPLRELGGGVEQVLALALILLGEPDEPGGIFMEEPETHLHPNAQRQLIRQLLMYKGKRQIFLTTHSPIFINELGTDANVYRFFRDNSGARCIELCVHRGDFRHALDELGISPSALLQTNCALWVEGPTEAILLRYWLQLIAPELKPHLHYEIVYTGGSLLDGLSADLDDSKLNDSTAEDLLRDIFKVCRHNFVVCDRDTSPDNAPQKRDVDRLQSLAKRAEMSSHLRMWVTDGYEIEWYFPRDIVAKLWNEEIADALFNNGKAGTEPFYAALKEIGGTGTKSAEKRKVEYARRAIKLNPAEDAQQAEQAKAVWFAGELGGKLRKRLDELVAFLRGANPLTNVQATPDLRNAG